MPSALDRETSTDMSPHSLQLDKLLLFGDSITEFAYDLLPQDSTATQFAFGPALQNSYTRRLDVVQRGFAGYNSKWALKLLPKILEYEDTPGTKVQLATVFFGTNDAVFEGMQKVPLDDYIANMRQIIQLLKERDIRVVVIGLAKHDADNWNPRKPQDVEQGVLRSNERSCEYNKALEELTIELDVAFVNLYKAFDNYSGDWRDLLIDGVHFTGEGYKIMYAEVLDSIRSKYPEWAPESVPYRLPYWRDFELQQFESKLGEWLN